MSDYIKIAIGIGVWYLFTSVLIIGVINVS